MLCDSVVETEATPTWTPAPRRETKPDWQTIDRALRTIARRQAELDAEEARWLREAEAVQIWRPLGMVSALDYLERVLGYGPRKAQDRLRVARALGSLPRLTAALSGGQLVYSAVRELTRVATPATEAGWVSAANGKTVRQLEELVAGHRPGDNPDDPPVPEVRTHVIRFELSAETFALLRQTRTVLDDEHGSNLPEDQFVAALCRAVLDGAPATEPTGRAKFQIAVTCASAAARAGNMAPARRSRSARLRSSARCAMPSTSDRSTAMHPSAHTRTFRQASCGSYGVATAVVAAWMVAAPREGSKFITLSIAPTVAGMIHWASPCCAVPVILHTTPGH